MPRLEHHLFTGDPVIVAPERRQRPHAFVTSANDGVCPFCPGNEDETPPEICRRNGSPHGWSMRVVPNRYPAVGAPLSGRHEVLIESPHHDLSPYDFGRELIDKVLQLYAERADAALADPSIATISIFKNFGRYGGESIAHPHSQLLALPFLTPVAKSLIRRSDAVSCQACAAASNPEAIVAGNELAIAFVPEGSRFAHEVAIVPRRHAVHFGERRDEIAAAASLLATVLAGLRRLAGAVDLNWYLQTAPRIDGRTADVHWVLVFVPRITVISGFELASGVMINVFAPEESARLLRSALKEV